MINIIDNLKEHKVEVLVEGPFLNTFLIHLYRQKVSISNIKYIDSNKISFITEKNNIKTITKNFSTYKITVKKEKGIYILKPLLKKHKLFLICMIAGIFLFLALQNIIVDVKVIHSDKKVRELVTDELEEYGVKRLTLKKDYDKLQIIKEKILNKYPDTLEWLEIKNVGMTYEVRVEERIITKIKEETSYCNITAKKGAIITKIINKQGMNYKDVGDYVSQGDIVIGGDIKVNEEVKKSLCATGEIYGEVWYTVNVNIPLNYNQKARTKKSRTNFMYETSKEQKVILKSRFKNKEVQNKKIFSLFGTTFYLQKEYEVKIQKKKYTKQEALDQALKLSKDKLNLKLDDKERIINQKVLNYQIKDSKMKVEVFASVEENISKIEHYTKVEEKEVE